MQEIELKNQIAELGRLGQFVETFAEAHDLTPKFTFGVNLVLDELVTNIISYGYTDGGEHTIRVRLACNGDELTAELEDDAIAFNPLERPEPDTTLPLEERPIGGLGIHFARKTMDQMSYRRDLDRNILVMKKRLGA